MPDGLDFKGKFYPVPGIIFLADITHRHQDGGLEPEHEIFDTLLATIRQARQILVLDQFLFNDFAGAGSGAWRPLSQELTDVLVQCRHEHPDLEVWFITDPLNTLYGGLESPQLKRLEAAGVHVVMTHLPALRDSNPAYSVWWRLLLRHWPQGWGPSLSNPLGPGRVPLRSYLDLLNFKANHRKTLIADDGAGNLVGFVSSANPHDGSSAHHNVAVRFTGQAVWDLLQTERAVARFSGAGMPDWRQWQPDRHDAPTPLEASVLTERAVERYLLEMLRTAEPQDKIQVAMFYLSSRPVVRALKQAHRRGVRVQVLLDPNKDAFGREKNGIPNRQTGRELHRAGIPVRWVQTRGEQFHAKMTLHTSARQGSRQLLIGSSNYTRRNLRNLNLETCLAVRGTGTDPFFMDALRFWNQIWQAEGDLPISVDYEQYADQSLRRILLYRFMEATGMSTF